jgi:vitamin B12 transporter
LSIICEIQAQENNDSTKLLPPVVVTAARIVQPQTDALLHTTIISAEDIKNNPGIDLPSLLAREAGLQITQSGGLGQPVSLFMRGQSSNHTLVLIDGVPIGQQTFSTTPAIEHILTSQIESIEIVRGNASAIYGSGAMGGVVQIFTKKPGEKPLTSFAAEVGAANSHIVNASHSGKADNLSYLLSVSDAGANGISANNIVQYPTENPDRDGYRNKSISGNIANEWSKGQVLGLRFYANDANYNFDGAGSGTPADNSFGQTKQDSVSLFMKNKIQKNWNSTFTLSQNNILSKSQNENINPLFVYQIIDRTRVTQAQWQNDFILSNEWSVIAGGSLSRQILNSYADFNPPEVQYGRSVGSVFSGINGRIDRHQIQFNARYDQVGGSGNDTTGYAGYGYYLTPSLKLTTSASTAFNAPSLARIYDVNSGNLDLKSETSVSYEAGIQYSLSNTLIRLVGFQTKTKNQFAKDPICANLFSCRTINLASGSNQGIEISASTVWDKTTLRSSLTLQNPVDDSTKKILDRNARVYGSISLGYALESWRFGADAIFSGMRHDQDYALLPAKVEKNLSAYSKVNFTARKQVSKELAVYARLENIFDRDYQTSYGYNQLPRSLFVGLNWQQ